MSKAARAQLPLPDRRGAVVCAILVAAVWLVFGRTVGHEFVNFDDEVYVYANPAVASGLNAGSFVSAFTHSHARNWHPLTTLSHMLDCQLFGLNPGGHHFVNVLLHSISAGLLFLTLRRMTKTVWPAAFVAALFALHPLRVESVAWIAERKDVLSGLFFMLTLNLYARFAESRGRTLKGDALLSPGSISARTEHRPPVKSARQKSRGQYAAVIGSFAAGLMSKPMLVTTPLVLLLLDYWPLQRSPIAGRGDKRQRHAQPVSWRPLLLEKLPLLFLSALSCIATLLAQGGSVGSMESLPLTWRIENALVSTVIYLVQTVWPTNLAPFYPHPAGTLPVVTVAAAAAVISLITFLAIVCRRRQPWLLIGWLWYLIMLFPVIGIVQVGMQARADRYTYLPHIGIYLAATWSIVALARRWRIPRAALIATAIIFLAAISWLAWVQAGSWRDSRALWTHTAAVTHDNEVAENNLGLLLEHDGRIDEAIGHYQRAVAIQTGRGQARYNLTLALSENNLGNAFARKGELDEAVAHYRKAVEWRSDYADGWYDLGLVLLQRREATEAIGCFEKALAVRPNDAAAHGHLGDAFHQQHADVAARAHYEKALALAPREVWAHYSLAWLLATTADASIRDGARALELAQRALALPGGDNAPIMRTLAAAYGAQAQFDEAIAAAERGLQISGAGGDGATTRSLRADLELYRANIPVREITPSF